MNKRERKRLERTAYHEAGHAVMAYRTRRPIRHATIVEDLDSLGHVMFLEPPGWFWDEVEYSHSKRAADLMQRMILTGLAGLAAEAKYAGRRNLVGAHADYSMAAEFALRASPSDTASAYLEWLTLVARDKITQPMNWMLVEAVAAELIEHRRLSGRKIRAVIQGRLDRYLDEISVESQKLLDRWQSTEAAQQA